MTKVVKNSAMPEALGNDPNDVIKGLFLRGLVFLGHHGLIVQLYSATPVILCNHSELKLWPGNS